VAVRSWRGVPLGGELVIVEGAGAAQHELMHLVDAVAWTRANAIVAGTPRLPHDPENEVVIASAP
jgi:hypothetical protein